MIFYFKICLNLKFYLRENFFVWVLVFKDKLDNFTFSEWLFKDCFKLNTKIKTNLLLKQITKICQNGNSIVTLFKYYFLNEPYYTVYWTKKKKTPKTFGFRTWCTKKPFGYWVEHHGYFLTSFRRQILHVLIKYIFLKLRLKANLNFESF